MESRAFGNTGLEVSALGLGAGSVGHEDLSDEYVADLLSAALDAGVTLIDTAPSYGLSEERVGRHPRRKEFVLSTKGGYGVPGVEDWTARAVTLSIDRSLRTLSVQTIDVFHLHSCPKEVLAKDDLLEALDRAKDAGKIRVAAYSGEGEALSWAVKSERFGSVQCSVNVFDQKSLEWAVQSAARRGLGVIAKRALANAVWRFREWPASEHVAYWERMQAMQLTSAKEGWVDLATRFSAFAPGVSSAIVGTSRIEHLMECVEAVDKGALAEDQRLRIEAAFAAKDRGWEGKI